MNDQGPQRDEAQPEVKNPVDEAIEHALDVFVYAPIGLLFEGASLLPQLVEKGKGQVTMARMLGQFAFTQGRGEATKLANRIQGQALELIAQLGEAVSVVPKSVPPTPTTTAVTDTVPRVAATAEETADKAAGAVVDVASLAIPDYDGLSASHVVNRLAGLAPAELEQVRLYELANRGRKTILSKVAQLQSG